jgi:hypothetical protein
MPAATGVPEVSRPRWALAPGTGGPAARVNDGARAIGWRRTLRPEGLWSVLRESPEHLPAVGRIGGPAAGRGLLDSSWRRRLGHAPGGRSGIRRRARREAGGRQPICRCPADHRIGGASARSSAARAGENARPMDRRTAPMCAPHIPHPQQKKSVPPGDRRRRSASTPTPSGAGQVAGQTHEFPARGQGLGMAPLLSASEALGRRCRGYRSQLRTAPALHRLVRGAALIGRAKNTAAKSAIARASRAGLIEEAFIAAS